MRALVYCIVLLNFFSTVSAGTIKTLDQQTAGLFAKAMNQLKESKLEFKVVKNLRLNAENSNLFREFLPEINKLLNIVLLDNTTLSFIKDCQDTPLPNTPSSLRKEFNLQINYYCHRRFLSHYFLEKNLTAMDNLRYDHLRKWMVYYLKGEAHSEFINFLKRLTPDSSIHREVSFLITEQSINNKTYPPDDVLALIDVDHNLDLRIRKMTNQEIRGTDYFSDEFTRLGTILKKTIDTESKEIVSDFVAQLETFYSENKDYIGPAIAWKTFFFAGRNLLVKDYDDHAFKLLSFASGIGADDQKQEALFYQLIGYLINNTPEKALAFIEKNQLDKNFDNNTSKFKYWIAYTYQQNNKEKIATEYFQKLIQDDPLTFYSIMGIKNLMKHTYSNNSRFVQDQFPTQNSTPLISLSSFPTYAQNMFERLDLWNELNVNSLASFEIEDLQNLTLKSTQLDDKKITQQELTHALYFYMIKMLASRKNYPLTFKVAAAGLEKGALKADKLLLSMLFPTELLPTVKRYSKLDPYLLMSLIRQESAFNPKAMSPVGAKGLMQLLLSTAKQFRRGVTKKNIMNPSINIEVGSRYFTYLLKKFNGNLVFALAAYNAGEGRVSEWRKGTFENDNPLLMIESIPFKETRDYVKFIYRNLFYYKILFDQLDTSSIEQSFKITSQN